MKKVLAILALALTAVPVMAQAHGYGGHHGGHWRYHPSYGWGWTVPVLVGGAVIGYEISRSQQPPVIVQQQPVIVQSPTQPPNMQSCSPWLDTQNPDGTITRTRTCTQ